MHKQLEDKNAAAFYTIFKLLHENGQETAPRGKRIKELINFDYNFPPWCRFMNFTHRKLNLDYIRAELRWYIKGDQNDHSIMKHSRNWKGLAQPDGTILSNYGHYIFKEFGLKKAISELSIDASSRRAVVPILKAEHVYINNVDIPCTAYVGFMIRDMKLICNVRMRSQDVVWGLGNDLPFFSILHEMVYVTLTHTYFNKLEMGRLNLRVDSMHIYERHFEMAEKILEDPEFKPIFIPRIGYNECYEMIDLWSNDKEIQQLPFGDQYFMRWLVHG